MQNQNQLLPPTDGVIVQTNGLTITRKLNDDEVHQWYSALKAIATNIEWHLGDFIHHIQDQGYAMPQSRQMELFDGATIAYTICGAFDKQTRVKSLTYAHHRCAYEETGGDTAKAIEWLHNARDNNLDVPALRRLIRESRLSLTQEELPRNSTLYKALDRATLWAVREQRKISNYTPDQARAVLLASRPLVDYIHGLEAVAEQSID